MSASKLNDPNPPSPDGFGGASDLPLTGTLVVAVEHAVAAPFASRQLADLGARVIKIERPGAGDFARGYDGTVNGLASHFVWVNRSKESLTLDLKRPEGTDVLRRLLSRADVLIHNLAPGAMTRLGFASSALHAQHPRLVVCEISGYGTTGPYRDKKAYDLLVQSEAGLLSITGTPEVPSKVGVSIADIAAGMYAFSGILAALLRRARTGAGAVLDVSMFDALAEWMGYPAYYTGYGGTPLPRSGAAHAAIAPYGPYTAGDGKVVYLGLQNEREWARFCADVLEQPGLTTDARFNSNAARVEHRDAMDAIITAAFARSTAADVVARLDAAHIASARMNTIHEFLEHPQLAARDKWRMVDSPAGPLRALVPPFGLDDVEPRMDPIPALGQHTDAILRELGYDEATVQEWRKQGVV
ncbi:MAG TPA: CaiB/BaiF CoA-transferase family protein [Vicinamibacterales bacterium]|nr:CaiB/BaiF CoA-transferase family protein [Vicinamibacterales bacterium]